MFQRRTGLSISQYISLVRIEKSKELLMDSGYSVCEVSARVRYASVSTFSRTFKQYVGVQPNLFRKMYRELQSGIVVTASPRFASPEETAGKAAFRA
ncbi:helix-turn-helix domain-containing protein [Paenibacillus macerans]|uniref:helix-turn-helix domain-containing protein n=1 Tax=Paenibacillus macerans TaxID=44252 RepID=UPI003D31C112